MNDQQHGCLCRKVHFRVTEPPLDSGYCHCRMCRQNSGAPVVAWVTFSGRELFLGSGRVQRLRILKSCQALLLLRMRELPCFHKLEVARGGQRQHRVVRRTQCVPAAQANFCREPDLMVPYGGRPATPSRLWGSIIRSTRILEPVPHARGLVVRRRQPCCLSIIHVRDPPAYTIATVTPVHQIASQYSITSCAPFQLRSAEGR
jgi:hypothetical protein